MNIPTFSIMGRPREDIYQEIVDLDQRYDRSDWRYKLEGNCIGRLILTLFSCCFCFIPDDRRSAWRERATWLHDNRPAADSPHYVLWQQAWNRVNRNRVKIYAPIFHDTNIRPTSFQPTRPIVNIQPNFVPQTVVQPRPVAEPHFVQPVTRPTINTQPNFVPHTVVQPRPQPHFVQPVTRPIVNTQPNFVPHTVVQPRPQPHFVPTQVARPPYRPPAAPVNNPIPIIGVNNRPMSFDPNRFVARNH